MLPIIATRVVVGVLAALGTLRFGTGVYFWRVTEALERPNYQVVETLENGVELRRYEPYLIAETIVEGSGFREPTGDGFRKCAGYIFGKNQKRSSSWFASKEEEPEKMAMTAPVRVSGKATAPKTKVSFVIGTQYSLSTAPKPLDSSVNLRQVPAHTLAVRTFSGPPPSDARVEKERTNIEAALTSAGKSVPAKSSETLVYGYHDPFITPNCLRRNEVALVVEGSV